jgi:hypothetical protein
MNNIHIKYVLKLNKFKIDENKTEEKEDIDWTNLF